jgi:hypothetical protein
MSDPGGFRPSRLWKQMPEERRVLAARTFWEDQESLDLQADAVQAIARRLNFRPRSVLSLPADKKARHLAGLPVVSEPLALRLLVVYHLAHQRPLIEAFLDGIGMAHKEGVIAEDAGPPDASRVPDAARGLSEKYPAGDVWLYFATLLSQDPDTWGVLTSLSEWQEAQPQQ